MTSKSCRDTLTEIGTTLRPFSRQPCRVLQMPSHMKRSSHVTIPLCSISGMNSAGEMLPICGCTQRASASMPMMRPVMMLHLGCK